MIEKLRALLSTYDNDISHGPGGSHIFSTWLLSKIATLVGDERRPTPGQELYSDYCDFSGGKSLATGATLPDFDGCKPEIQAAWHFVANRQALRAGFEPFPFPEGRVGELLKQRSQALRRRA